MRAGIAAAALALLCAAPAHANAPVADAPGWTLVDDVPTGCWAEHEGDVRVRLMPSRSGHPVLAVSRDGWRRPDGLVHFDIKIDGGAPTNLVGSVVLNVLLIAFAPSTEPALLKASSLTWQMPWDEFTTPVPGIGTAFNAVMQCQATKTRSSP